MPELKEVEPSQIDEIVAQTKLLRDAARQSKQHLLAEKLHKIVAAAEKAIETLLKPSATNQARTMEETVTQPSTTINGKDNNNNNNTNNITKNMSQSERVLRP